MEILYFYFERYRLKVGGIILNNNCSALENSSIFPKLII